MDLVELGLMLSWAMVAIGLVYYALSVASDVTYVTLADGRKQERSIPLVFKLLLPFASNLDRFVARECFKAEIEKSEKTLVAAGFEGLISGVEFTELRFLVPAVLGALWSAYVLTMAEILPGSVVDEEKLLICLLGVALFYVQPASWLRTVLKKRHASIVKALPFVLDTLTLSVEAGMDFISALQRNCTAAKLDPLNEELLRMTKEIQVGSSRKTALKNMSDRVGQSDLKQVANALIQADELGVSVGAMLRIQSDQMRARRFDRAEKLANEAPVKMLGPLMLCIFPAVFIILLGPLLVLALKGMF